MPEGAKWCPSCQAFKDREAFGRNRSSHDGLTAYCRPCHNIKVRESKNRNGGYREYHLRRRYGIGAADVDAMIEAQGGTCAVCPGKPEHVDHDHRTGAVRGVLCFNCNQALGNARDNLLVLKGLQEYLMAHQVRQFNEQFGVTVTESRVEDVLIEVIAGHGRP